METKERKLIRILVIAIMLIIIAQIKVNASEPSAEPEQTAEPEITGSVATAEELVAAVGKEGINTITLTADMDLSNLNEKPEKPDAPVALDISGKVLDLNSHKISANNFTVAFQGTNCTIKNGTFDAKGGSYALFIGDEGTTNNLTIENITTAGGINIYNADNVVIQNSIVEGTKYYSVWCDENGHATIKSGTFRSTATSTTAILGISKTEGKLDIEGGTFMTLGKKLALDDKDEDGNAQYNSPVISGGNFDIEVSADYCKQGFEPVQLSESIYSVCNHENIEIRNQKEATIENNGYTGDKYCVRCNKLISMRRGSNI